MKMHGMWLLGTTMVPNLSPSKGTVSATLEPLADKSSKSTDVLIAPTIIPNDVVEFKLSFLLGNILF